MYFVLFFLTNFILNIHIFIKLVHIIDEGTREYKFSLLFVIIINTQKNTLDCEYITLPCDVGVELHHCLYPCYVVKGN